jgi:hypothetical protein
MTIGEQCVFGPVETTGYFIGEKYCYTHKQHVSDELKACLWVMPENKDKHALRAEQKHAYQNDGDLAWSSRLNQESDVCLEVTERAAGDINVTRRLHGST